MKCYWHYITYSSYIKKGPKTNKIWLQKNEKSDKIKLLNECDQVELQCPPPPFTTF